MNDTQDTELGLEDQTGALLMLNKQERRLLRALLDMALASATSRERIVEDLGQEYIDVGENLLETLSGP